MSSNEKKSWSELNRIRKEERKKWKQKNLTKKLLKKVAAKSAETVAGAANESNPTEEEVRTMSMAVPGSILENAQSPELCTYLAGQIARAACIFQVDEIVVFDDYGDTGEDSPRKSCVRLGRILQYLECPQYLRKHFFPIHADLRYCGVLNPLNAPHHLKPDEHFEFREGVVSNKPVKNGGSYVNVGLKRDVHVDRSLTPGIRCTVRLLPSTCETSKKIKGIVVAPDTPRKETGTYWGYMVRIATSLSKVFSQSLYKDGYDLTIGTSDKGTSIDDRPDFPPHKHSLIVFGGLLGLEAALENDPILESDDPSMIFDHYLNTLPDQGSKTIRTEEAILISLTALRTKFREAKNS